MPCWPQPLRMVEPSIRPTFGPRVGHEILSPSTTSRAVSQLAVVLSPQGRDARAWTFRARSCIIGMCNHGCKNSVDRRARAQWVLLAYRLPREPSTPRIAMWRKLKRLGAAQLLDGLVALPLDSRNREQPRVAGRGGGGCGGGGDDLDRRARLRRAGARARGADARGGGGRVPGRDRGGRERCARRAAGDSGARLARLRRELRRIRSRDYFPPPERELAQRAVESLATSLEEAAA